VVDEAIRKANVLIEALGWILRFRDRHVVLKLGGSALENPETVRSLLTDVVFMEAVGLHPIVVHGGGKAINLAMEAAGIQTHFVQGRRYTDKQTLDIVATVLTDDICQSLVTAIQEQGGRAVPLTFRTQNCLIAERLTLPGENGRLVDLGYVGNVVDLNRSLLLDTCSCGSIPVIPSLALDSKGQLFNVNADTAAAAVARMLKAEKLVFLSDVPGIYLNRDDPTSLQSHLEAHRCRELIASGSIQTGMVPKVEAALEALSAGVHKVHIVDGRMPHSVLLEIYSNRGIGTEIVP